MSEPEEEFHDAQEDFFYDAVEYVNIGELLQDTDSAYEGEDYTYDPQLLQDTDSDSAYEGEDYQPPAQIYRPITIDDWEHMF